MNLRQKIENKEKINGTIVSLCDPCVCEIMANVGFDCIWIDMEHTYLTCKDVLCHLNAARSRGASAIVRVPQNDLTTTKRILEMGPDGIIFPMVRSLKEFNELMAMTLYPPLGTRGFGPMRAMEYDSSKALDYVNKGSLEMCRFVQIECISMIDELEEIVKNPYIDGFIFGANDLSGSAGDFLNVYGEKTVSQIKRATEIIKKSGKYVGIACGSTKETLDFWSQFDFDITFAFGDFNYIYDYAKQTLNILNSKG